MLSRGMLRRRIDLKCAVLAKRSTSTEATTWDNAKQFKKLPGPGKLPMLRGFMPGGQFYKKSMTEFQLICHKNYGDIFVLPGMLGKPEAVMTFNPDDFTKVFRSEGVWPIRPGLDTITYYRRERRQDLFHEYKGIFAEDGEKWAKMRSIANPVLMQPKNSKIYIPKMDQVADEFITRIKAIRDPNSSEVPKTFENEINHWALESLSLVALDTKLDLINGTDNPDANHLISSLKTFFNLISKLDLQPSLWKFVATPKFNELMAAFDVITEMSVKYTDAALQRMEKSPEQDSAKQSILEKLVKIDRNAAIIMAMDLLLAGVDTTSSALTSCLLCLAKSPEKQQKLRDELNGVLPTLDTPLTDERLGQLPFLRACIKESLRLYPVTTGNARITNQNAVLSGYQIPKGTLVAMASHVQLKSETYFERADEFLPERWLREAKREESSCPIRTTKNPFVFLPFGFGPRMCIGRRLVNLEMEVVLSKIVRNYMVKFDYPTKDAFRTVVFNVPNIPLTFTFEDV